MKISFRKSETDIIASVRNGDSSAMEVIYSKYRNEFIGWSMSKFGIDESDALDHYQDTLTIFFEKVISGSLVTVESSIKTYLFGIGKNKVRQGLDESSKRERHEPGLAEHFTFLAEDDNAQGIIEEAKAQTKKALNSIGDSCKKILKLFYFEQRSMSEIADVMGHKNEGVSRTTKKRCLEKIRQQLTLPSTNG